MKLRCFTMWMRPAGAGVTVALLALFSARAENEPTQVERNQTVTDEVPDGYFQDSYVHSAMGTYFEFVVYGERGKDSSTQFSRAADEAFKAIDSLEARSSSWRTSSQTSRVNREAAERPIRVAADIFGMLEAAQAFYRETNGAFDVTVGPLVTLWRKCREKNKLPTEAELSEARAVVGFDKVTLNPEARTVAFAWPGMRLDFGGIGKGLALDEAARVLSGYGVRMAVLQGGTSTVVAMGAPPGKEGWTIRVQHPVKENEDIATFVLKDESFSSSGHVEDVMVLDGKKYGHILDPASGMPVEGIIMSMAIAPTGMETDALSTAFFVMGPEGTARYCRNHPGVRGVIVPDSEEGHFEPIRIGFDD